MEASQIQTTTNVLDVLSEASRLVSTCTPLSKILNIISPFINVAPFLGAALEGNNKCLLPDTNHQEILQCFEKLYAGIGHVRDDIRKLETTIKWECTKLQYGEVVNRIQVGMRYCLEIGKAKDKDDKVRHQGRLREVCSGQEFNLALNAPLDGIGGTGLLGSSILDDFCEKSNGHRSQISSLASRLLQLLCSGLIVTATYDTAKRGEKGGKDMIKLYKGRLMVVSAKIQSVLDSCVHNFKEHMLSDLNSILDKKGPSNDSRLYELCAIMKEKYDWLEHFCLVYDDLKGPSYHYFEGDRVESLHRNGKCGIVFYRTAGEPAQNPARCDEAQKIVYNTVCYNAQKGCNTIVAKLAQAGILWSGCVVVGISAKVRFGGTFSTPIVRADGHYAHAMAMLQ